MTSGGIRILLVDDESSIRRALRPPLMELGFQVTEASRGEEALQILRGATFDIVLLDINMPVMDGFDFLEEYTKAHKCLEKTLIYAHILLSGCRQSQSQIIRSGKRLFRKATF